MTNTSATPAINRTATALLIQMLPAGQPVARPRPFVRDGSPGFHPGAFWRVPEPTHPGRPQVPGLGPVLAGAALRPLSVGVHFAVGIEPAEDVAVDVHRDGSVITGHLLPQLRGAIDYLLGRLLSQSVAVS